jgi:class 3 adenylate cyclase
MLNHEDNQAAEMIKMAIGMVEAVRQLNKEYAWNFQIRVGIGQGSLSACVLGRSKISFDCYGPAVNIAHHLESTSRPGCIHVCENVYQTVNENYQFVKHGNHTVDGTTISSYLLRGMLGSPAVMQEGELLTRLALPIRVSTPTEESAQVSPSNDMMFHRVFDANSPNQEVNPTLPTAVPPTPVPVGKSYKLNKVFLIFPTIGKNIELYQLLYQDMLTNHRVIAVVQAIMFVVLVAILIGPYSWIASDPGFIIMAVITAIYLLTTVIFLTPLSRRFMITDVLMTFFLVLCNFAFAISSSVFNATATMKNNYYIIHMLVGIYMFNGFVMLPHIIRVLLSVLLSIVAFAMRLAFYSTDYGGAAVALATGIVFSVLHGVAGYITTRSVYNSFLTNEEIKAKIEVTTIEQKRNDEIIAGTLPAAIVTRLGTAEENVCDMIKSGSACFISITDIDEILRSSPETTIELLNRVFTSFDNLCDKYNCHKIKSIGTVYLAVSGIEQRTDVNHYEQMANFALRARDSADQILSDTGSDTTEKPRTQIGLHCGPFAAGVLGSSKFLYDVFGDTINTASRMMSTGDKNQIQLCGITHNLLTLKFEMEYRGVVQVKGKGELETWWLVGVKDTRD